MIVTATELANGDLLFDPDDDVNGTPMTTFDFSVNDGFIDSAASATISLNIDPDNDYPTGSGAMFTTLEDISLVIDGTSPTNLLTNVTDVDGDVLTVTPTVVSGPSNGTLSLNIDGTFTYEPDDDFNGVDSFMYEVVDGSGGSIVVTATINVSPDNDDPVLIIKPGVVNVSENTVNVDTLTSTDVDGGLPSYSIAGTGDDDALFDVVGNQLVFKSKPDFENPASLSGNNFYAVDVRVDDGLGGFDIGSITVHVVNDSDRPQAFGDAFSVNEGEDFNSVFSLLDNDIDVAGDGFTTTVVGGGPTHGSITLNPDGTFEYQHDGSETTIDTFVYQVTAADGQTDTATVTININPIQDAPVANDDGVFELNSGESIVVTADTILANDIDADSADTEYRHRRHARQWRCVYRRRWESCFST